MRERILGNVVDPKDACIGRGTPKGLHAVLENNHVEDLARLFVGDMREEVHFLFLREVGVDEDSVGGKVVTKRLKQISECQRQGLRRGQNGGGRVKGKRRHEKNGIS